MMLVSTIPRDRSALIGIEHFVVDHCVDVRTKSIGINRASACPTGEKLFARDKRSGPSQRDQFTDLMSIAGDGECLAVFDRVHDLFGAQAKVTLADLWLDRPKNTVAPGSAPASLSVRTARPDAG